MQPEQVHLAQQWIAKAEEDFRNGEYVSTLKEDCPLSTVCFHSQQCVEKYLKALMICCCLPVPRSHDFIELLHRIPLNNRPDVSEASLASLNRYAVETRYPGDWDIISRREAEDAPDSARLVREIVRPLLVERMRQTHTDGPPHNEDVPRD